MGVRSQVEALILWVCKKQNIDAPKFARLYDVRHSGEYRPNVQTIHYKVAGYSDIQIVSCLLHELGHHRLNVLYPRRRFSVVWNEYYAEKYSVLTMMRYFAESFELYHREQWRRDLALAKKYYPNHYLAFSTVYYEYERGLLKVNHGNHTFPYK